MLSGMPAASRPFGNVSVGLPLKSKGAVKRNAEKHVGILAIGLHQLEARNRHRHRRYEKDVDGFEQLRQLAGKSQALEIDAAISVPFVASPCSISAARSGPYSDFLAG